LIRAVLPGIRFESAASVTSAELNELFESAWPNHARRDFTPILSRSLTYVCAFAEQRLVGFVNAAWDGGVHAFVLDTTVHHDFQRRGIGHLLVHHLIDSVRAKSCIQWLHVDFEPHLRGFYEGLGFSATAAGLLKLC
jgi:GNAT superfamily N-acetyltransferase